MADYDDDVDERDERARYDSEISTPRSEGFDYTAGSQPRSAASSSSGSVHEGENDSHHSPGQSLEAAGSHESLTERFKRYLRRILPGVRRSSPRAELRVRKEFRVPLGRYGRSRSGSSHSSGSPDGFAYDERYDSSDLSYAGGGARADPHKHHHHDDHDHTNRAAAYEAYEDEVYDPTPGSPGADSHEGHHHHRQHHHHNHHLQDTSHHHHHHHHQAHDGHAHSGAAQLDSEPQVAGVSDEPLEREHELEGEEYEDEAEDGDEDEELGEESPLTDGPLSPRSRSTSRSGRSTSSSGSVASRSSGSRSRSRSVGSLRSGGRSRSRSASGSGTRSRSASGSGTRSRAASRSRSASRSGTRSGSRRSSRASSRGSRTSTGSRSGPRARQRSSSR